MKKWTVIALLSLVVACSNDDEATQPTPVGASGDPSGSAVALSGDTIATVFGQPVTKTVFDAYRATRGQHEGEVDEAHRQQELSQFLDLFVISGGEPGELPPEASGLTGGDLELAQLYAGVQQAIERWQSDNPVEDAAVRQRYDAIANSAAVVRDYKLRHLNVADLAHAGRLQVALNEGKSFAQVEAELAEQSGPTAAGDLGWVPTEALTEPLVNNIESASDLGITEPVGSEQGAHIFLVEAARDIAPPTYEEIAEELRGSIAQQRFYQFVERRRAEANIQIR